MRCRHCNVDLTQIFVDLGSAPPSNAYLTQEDLKAPEKWYPLKVMVCERCWLVQTEDFVGAEELFKDDYAYFSSYSSSWLAHAENYVANIVLRLGLNQESTVVEVAANDGYLLQYVKARGIPCYGIEPTRGTAQAARAKGIEIVEDFFGLAKAHSLVSSGRQADLMIANNVLAHVPDINDFVAAFATLSKPSGVATFEFPHLLSLVEHNQFDTIYHEHYSYLSFSTVCDIFKANGLDVFDVEELPTHGGSLRVYAQRRESGLHASTQAVAGLREREEQAGIRSMAFYRGFQGIAERIKNDVLSFLLEAKLSHTKVAAYGAAAKGNTLLNFAGVRRDLVEYVVDRNPAKQNKFMPGSRIPIRHPDFLHERKPDYVGILPWNIAEEVRTENAFIREWGGEFFVGVPAFETC